MKFPVIDFFNNVLLRIIGVTIVTIGVISFFSYTIYLSNAWLALLLKSFILVVAIISSIILFGLNKGEYKFIINYSKKKILKR